MTPPIGTLRHLVLVMTIAAPLTIIRAAEPPPDTIGQRMQPCVACHGKEGRATNQGYFPRIAGKPADYLFNQLVAFRDGRRSNPTMAYFVEHMTDAYLKEIARYFADLQLPYPAPREIKASSEQTARSEALVRHGDPALDVPACTSCHGAALTGALPATPGLLGLSREYLLLQFGSWRVGVRHAAEPDCMARIVARISPQDLSAIAGWLSSQPLPVNTAPVAPLAQAQPLKCGSVPP
jgi:cytochrome c553